MALNKQSGNMYGFVTHTWNPIKGKCPHDCSYCYMKRFPQKELRFDEKCFGDFLTDDNFIFVGSSTDMFAQDIPYDWIHDILDFCCNYKSKFLFQSKNPIRFHKFTFPENSILATTIETDDQIILDKYSGGVDVKSRRYGITRWKGKRMVTIEPIMNFNIIELRDLIYSIKPFQVNIGADSGHNNLPEPPREHIERLIAGLRKFTTVHLKDNLKRLL